MKAEEMTIQQISDAIKRYDTLMSSSAEYREKYRKTEKGKKKHNECSKRSYYKRKLKALEGLEHLTARQEKYKKKWEEGLALLSV